MIHPGALIPPRTPHALTMLRTSIVNHLASRAHCAHRHRDILAAPTGALQSAWRAGFIGWVLTAVASSALALDARTARDAAFDRMYEAPTDRAAMLDYARLSAALRDYEAVASVLERLVALEPGNREARKQLALAYFALGSDVMADSQLQWIADADPVMAAEVVAYREALARRTAPSDFSGSVWAGALYVSHPDRYFTEAGLALTHRHDLGGAHAATWLTRLSASAGAPVDIPDADAGHHIELRSGPLWRVSQTATGARLQPYVLWSNTQDAYGVESHRAGLGTLAQWPVGQAGVTGHVVWGRFDEGPSRSGAFGRTDWSVQWSLPGDAFIRPRITIARQYGGTRADYRRASVGVDGGFERRPVIGGVPRPMRITISALRDQRVTPGGIREDRTSLATTVRTPLGNNQWAELGGGRTAIDPTQRSVGWLTLRIGRDF